MKKERKIYRHGDVLIRETAKPEKAVLKETAATLTLAEGEATGHHHTLYGDLPISLFEYDERRFLELQKSVSLRHQEHKEIRIDPGQYEIIIENEWDYFEEELKRVRD